MTALQITRHVACPVGQVPAFLERFFAGHAGENGDSVLTLRAPINVAGLREVELARVSVVHVAPAHRPGEMIARYAVSWEAAKSGPFPRFTGTLCVPNDEDYDSCFLRLEGTYEPPLGALGQAFDTAIGHAIAQRTGEDLLARIAAYLEESSRRFEAAKVHPEGV